MTPLAVTSDAALFHEWRKRVKSHWYHVRLLESLHSGARARARTLDRLETLLGDAHDLAMLQQTLLSEHARQFGDARSRDLVLGTISRAETSLRRRALGLGHRTFAKRPGEFAKSVKPPSLPVRLIGTIVDGAHPRGLFMTGLAIFTSPASGSSSTTPTVRWPDMSASTPVTRLLILATLSA